MTTSQPHPAPAANPPSLSPGRAFKRWLCCSVVAVLSGLYLATRDHLADGPVQAPPAAMATPAQPQPLNAVASSTPPDEPMPADFHHFALNALLVPLLDDAVPPLWTDVAVDFSCDPGTSVMVNGEPLVPGTPIPASTFTVQWKMNRCTPMGPDAVEVTGNVTLVVSHEDDGLSAVVMPDRLRLDSPTGRAWLHAPFSAKASMLMAVRRR